MAVIAGEDARREAMTGKAAAEAAAAQAAAIKLAADGGLGRRGNQGESRRRQDLLRRLNQALPTRETDRGLVSEIGGVQFATGTADLNSAARESLARLAGIVASYPDLKFKIEGHTDNVGTTDTNSVLSLQRAISVRDYLIGQRVAASNIDAEGLGSAHPVADNESADGRARNRRVEIVISGGSLAAAAGTSPADLRFRALRGGSRNQRARVVAPSSLNQFSTSSICVEGCSGSMGRTMRKRPSAATS